MSTAHGSLLRPVLTDQVSTPAAQYTQALALPLPGVGQLVFVSGQGPTDAAGNVVGVDDPETQVRQVFANIQALLAAAGGGLEHIAEMTLYLRDINHRPLVTKVRAEVLKQPYPTATMVEISDFAAPEWLVEISALAVVPA